MAVAAETLAFVPRKGNPDASSGATPHTLACSVITSLEQLAILGTDWQMLERDYGESHQLFQTFAWCTHWLRAAQRVGDKSQGMRIITVRDGGRLVLVWPLHIAKGRFATTATWLGEPLTQYGDVIAAGGPLRSRWIEAAWDKARQLEGVDILWLRRVRDDATIRPLLAEHATLLPDRTDALSMDLAGACDWAAIEARFKAKSVKNRKRHRRRICERGELQFVAAEHSTRALDLARQAIRFKQQWIADRGLAHDPFRDATYREALWSMVRGDAPRLACRVFAHELDGEPTAIDIAFSFKGRHYAHIAAMNLDFETYGPGGLLTQDVMRAALEQGSTCYDLMAPAAAYKQEWTDTRVPLHAYAAALTPRGKAIVSVYLAHLRPRLKALVERLPASIRRHLR